MVDKTGKEERTWTEEIEVYASELVDRVKELIRAGNVRRLIIKNANNEVLVEIPLTAGIATGSVVTLFAPILVALGAMAALLAKVRIEVVRTKAEGEK
jgi:hypothetical protein